LIAFSEGEYDGAISQNRQVAGTYLHGLFESTAVIEQLLAWTGYEAEPPEFDYRTHRLEALDRLADTLEAHMDIDTLMSLFQPETAR